MKSVQTIVPVVLLSGFTLLAGHVFAADPDSPAGSFATQSPATFTMQAAHDDYRSDLVLPDGWRDVGGEEDWIAKLKRIYLACDRAATSGRLNSGGIMQCSIVYEELKRWAFDGDFDKMLAWSKTIPSGRDSGR